MSGKRILYIEDNFENRILVKRVLEVEGYVVLEADDGPSGMQVAEQEVPDLILMGISFRPWRGACRSYPVFRRQSLR